MTRSRSTSTPVAEDGRAGRLAVVSLVAAAVAVAILLVSFRGLVFVTLPLAAVACVLGAWGAVHAARPSSRLVAVAGLTLGLLALLVSVAALAADLTVDNGYEFYERREP
jgi:hypothetical protein